MRYIPWALSSMKCMLIIDGKWTYVGSAYACVLLVGLRDNRQICHASFLKHTGCKQMGFVTIVHFRSNNHCQLPTPTSMGKMLQESIKIDKITKAKQNKTHPCVYFMRYFVYRNDGYCRISAQVYFVEDSVLPLRNTRTIVIFAVH